MIGSFRFPKSFVRRMERKHRAFMRMLTQSLPEYEWFRRSNHRARKAAMRARRRSQ